MTKLKNRSEGAAVSEEKKEILEDPAGLRIFDDLLLSNVFDRQIPETQLLIR